MAAGILPVSESGFQPDGNGESAYAEHAKFFHARFTFDASFRAAGCRPHWQARMPGRHKWTPQTGNLIHHAGLPDFRFVVFENLL